MEVGSQKASEIPNRNGLAPNVSIDVKPELLDGPSGKRNLLIADGRFSTLKLTFGSNVSLRVLEIDGSEAYRGGDQIADPHDSG